MSDEIKALIIYRLEKADRTLETAKNVAGNDWDTVANRLYYASYHAVGALLLKFSSKGPKTHSGVKTLFNQHFVKTGLVPSKLGVFYAKVFQMRQDADYADLIPFLEEDIKPLIPETEKFINTIKKLIDQK